jgi:hypothetical protein
MVHGPQVFNHLVKQFTFIWRNNPETIINGRISTRGHIKHVFAAFDTVVLLCIEMKPKVGNEEERLNAIARVIGECNSKPEVF